MIQPILFKQGINQAISGLYTALYTTATIDEEDYIKIKQLYNELLEFRKNTNFKYFT